MLDIKELALKGGGAKGFIYIGVAKALERLGLLPQIECYAGSSVGAIAALLLSSGIPIDKLEEQFLGLNIPDLLSEGFLTEIYDFIEYDGFHNGDKLTKWFEDFIEQVTGDRNCTFEQWHELKDIKGLKDLTIEAGCLEFQTNIPFSSRPPLDETKHQQMVDALGFDPRKQPIAQALRASISFPGYFTLFTFKGLTFVDGGLLDNLPIKEFIHHGKLDKEAYAVWLGSNEEIQRILQGKLEKAPSGEWFSKIKDFYNMLTGVQGFQVSSMPYKDMIIFARTLGVGPLDFDIDIEIKNALALSGEFAVYQYMLQHYPDFMYEKFENPAQLLFIRLILEPLLDTESNENAGEFTKTLEDLLNNAGTIFSRPIPSHPPSQPSELVKQRPEVQKKVDEAPPDGAWRCHLM